MPESVNENMSYLFLAVLGSSLLRAFPWLWQLFSSRGVQASRRGDFCCGAWARLPGLQCLQPQKLWLQGSGAQAKLYSSLILSTLSLSLFPLFSRFLLNFF